VLSDWLVPAVAYCPETQSACAGWQIGGLDFFLNPPGFLNPVILLFEVAKRKRKKAKSN
jgi:hypothetical protein